MISSVVAVAMAAWMQPADTTRASREAFTACLRTYVERVTQNRMAPAEFATAYPQQCSAQEQTYRTAVIAREVASRMSRSDAEESAGLEIEDARANFRDRFEMAQGSAPAAAASVQQAAAPAPAAAPAAQASVQPASQQTPPPQSASSPN